ncbi:MAG: HAD family phosphatase [Deltaproteobacteria bacterium]|nr:HAD family phosphatase [Deltaproteobacteria bacterium]MBI2500130.1 HAD family phosphatase [Deltaproteobacteria bacterium]MBI4196712.1 HAD family phosphatase [Deltaproteobacteria bacterium]
MLRAILFDFDGVLCDTEPLHCRLVQAVLLFHGISLSKEEYYQDYLGLDDRALLEAVFKKHEKRLDSALLEEMMAEKNSAFLKETVGHSLLYPNIKELITSLHPDYYMGVVSGALKNEILSILSGEGLMPMFQVIVAADDVKKCKPDPEGYQAALNLLNRDHVPESEILLPNECLVVEDSPWGIESAKAAGMKCLAVATSYKKEQLNAADWILDRADSQLRDILLHFS